MGCSDAPGTKVTEPATAEVGTGVDLWEPFANDIVYLVEGAQGGRHVIGNVKMTGMDPGTSRADAPATRFDLFRPDGSRASQDIPPFHQPFVETPDGKLSLPFGRIVFVDSLAADILDTMVEIRVELTAEDGQTAGDARWVLVKPYVP
ncbi:MAG: hypothetical protein NT062_04420 [Proteobacteria bacterium]|nr:hypothetical protein [Pseudomonadota bacterium]